MSVHILRPPFALDPLIAEAKQRRRRRRLLALAFLLAGALASSSVLAWHERGGSGGARGAVTNGADVRFSGSVRVGALEISIPAGFMHRQAAFGSMCRVSCAVILSNGRVLTDGNSVFVPGRNPLAPSRVTLQLYVWAGTSCAAAGRPPCATNLRFPVTLGELGREYGPETSQNGTRRIIVLAKAAPNPGLYAIDLWVGRDASPADRAAAVEALRSIRAAAK